MPSNEEAYSADLAHQKKVSRDLIQEASVIKPKLNDPRQRRLRELVSDLEVILLQIANLEAEQDQPEIEILKSGVDRKGLLLKINLEQLRLSNPKTEKPASNKKKAARRFKEDTMYQTHHGENGDIAGMALGMCCWFRRYAQTGRRRRRRMPSGTSYAKPITTFWMESGPARSRLWKST